MTNKPQTYNLTSEHFARAYADIDRRRGELIASHATAMAELGHELAELEACEITAAKIAERYSEDSGASQRANGRARKTLNADGSPRLPNTGRPYKRKDDARIAAASRGQLEQLAQELGRPYAGLLKRHEILLKQRKREKADTPAPARARTHRLPYNTGPGTPFKEPDGSREFRRPTEAELTEAERIAEERSKAGTPMPVPVFDPSEIQKEPLAPPEPPESQEPDTIIFCNTVAGQAAQASLDARSGSENSAIVEPGVPTHIDADYGACPTDPVRIESTKTPAPPPARPADPNSAVRELAEFDARRQRMPRAKPGIPVRGLTNDGPGHDRFLDPVAFASRQPD